VVWVVYQILHEGGKIDDQMADPTLFSTFWLQGYNIFEL
jgi:hypothetical protein